MSPARPRRGGIRTGRDPDYLAFVRRATAGPPAAPVSRQQERLDLRAVMARVPRAPVDSVTEHDLLLPAGRTMAARLYRPAGPLADTCLVYVHGGGWSVGDVESWDPVVRSLVVACGVSILAIEQRQAPEDPYPAALDDTVGAVRWLRSHAAGIGLDPARIGLAGDSSGGNVAAAAALRLRDEGDPPLLLQLLVYAPLDLVHPPTDPPDPDGVDWRRREAGAVVAPYLGGADPEHAYLSPLLADDVTGLCPAVVVTAEYDRLRADGERYAARLEQSGVPVELVAGAGLDHAFVAWVTYARRPREAVEEIGAAVRRLLSGSRG